MGSRVREVRSLRVERDSTAVGREEHVIQMESEIPATVNNRLSCNRRRLSLATATPTPISRNRRNPIPILHLLDPRNTRQKRRITALILKFTLQMQHQRMTIHYPRTLTLKYPR